MFLFFFFNDTATTEIYTLSLHDALPISADFSLRALQLDDVFNLVSVEQLRGGQQLNVARIRSEEHTSELQSRPHLVCRLLLEKKNDANDASAILWYEQNRLTPHAYRPRT